MFMVHIKIIVNKTSWLWSLFDGFQSLHWVLSCISGRDSLVWRFTVGRSTVGRSTVGRSTVGRSTVGRSTVGRSTVGRSTVGRSTVGRSTVGRSTVGRSTSLSVYYVHMCVLLCIHCNCEFNKCLSVIASCGTYIEIPLFTDMQWIFGRCMYSAPICK